MKRNRTSLVAAVATFSVAILCAGVSFGQTLPQSPDEVARTAREWSEYVKRSQEVIQQLQNRTDEAIRAANSRAILSGLSAVLVSGDVQASPAGTGDDIPAAARKALADMKDFLPYKSYRLLDGITTPGDGRFTSRLNGADGHAYLLELNAVRPAPGSARSSQEGALQISVRLDGLDEFDATHARRDLLLMRAIELNKKGLIPDSEVQGLLSQLGRPLITTSFSMEAGETVVVGTSRVNGDKALILLLTAVPK